MIALLLLLACSDDVDACEFGAAMGAEFASHCHTEAVDVLCQSERGAEWDAECARCALDGYNDAIEDCP